MYSTRLKGFPVHLECMRLAPSQRDTREMDRILVCGESSKVTFGFGRRDETRPEPRIQRSEERDAEGDGAQGRARRRELSCGRSGHP